MTLEVHWVVYYILVGMFFVLVPLTHPLRFNQVVDDLYYRLLGESAMKDKGEGNLSMERAVGLIVFLWPLFLGVIVLLIVLVALKEKFFKP